ncbi:MAG: hypothetical protein WC588_02775 [Candidatus Micrarchaeia archaeon]
MAVEALMVLAISTFILAKSSEVVVESAVKLARFFHIGTLAIGMLLVAVSTSLPELSVSVVSSSAGEGAIAAGNVFGSNIANILLILGLGAALYGFRVDKESLKDIGIVLVLTTAISAYVLFHSLVFGSALGLYEGVALLIIAGWYGMRMLSKKRMDGGHAEKEVTRHEGMVAFLLFFAAIFIVIISSSFVVSSAVELADAFGLAKSFIGATIIAIGTSLPELTIDLQAIRKKQYGLALGDAIGSNMANITLVLGVAAAINPITVTLGVFVAALLFAVVANIAFFYVAAIKKAFGRREGIAMLLLYALYLVVIFSLQFSAIPSAGG